MHMNVFTSMKIVISDTTMRLWDSILARTAWRLNTFHPEIPAKPDLKSGKAARKGANSATMADEEVCTNDHLQDDRRQGHRQTATSPKDGSSGRNPQPLPLPATKFKYISYADAEQHSLLNEPRIRKL